MDYEKWPDRRKLTIYFRGFLCAAFIVLLVLGFILKWMMLTKMMCLSVAACFAIFTYTAVNEKKQVDEKASISNSSAKKIKKKEVIPDRSKTVQPKKLK